MIINNSSLNEFSTNESPTQSPSKHQKDQKSLFQNFFSSKSNFNKFFPKKLKIENSKNFQKAGIIKKMNKPKRKRRIIRKIIKKKLGNSSSLLDFDLIIKEVLENKNLNINNLDAVKEDFAVHKYVGLERRPLNKNLLEILNKNEKGKKLILNSFILILILVNINPKEQNKIEINNIINKCAFNRNNEIYSSSSFNPNNLKFNGRKSKQNEVSSNFVELTEEYFENDKEEVRNKL